jgi:putative salt-induced outer membrane protein YdiY
VTGLVAVVDRDQKAAVDIGRRLICKPALRYGSARAIADRAAAYEEDHVLTGCLHFRNSALAQ